MGARTDIVYKVSSNDGQSWSPLRVLYSEWVPPGHSWHCYTKNATFNATLQNYWGPRDGWLDYRVPPPAQLPCQNLTLPQAKALCAHSTECFGFEFFDHEREPRSSTVLTVTFKTAARFTPDHGNAVTLHNPAPVAVDNGRALVLFSRNNAQLFAMRTLDASASRWSPPEQISIQSGPLEGATLGPPGGVRLTVPGQTSPRIAIAIGSRSLGGGGALLSDDDGATWRVSRLANPRGGEAQLAMAPNGSLLLNSRGDRQGVRWQSESHDFGETWSAPRVLDFGFGSSCEGSLIRVPNSSDLLFSHAGRVWNRWNRWNLTIWRSQNSGANWTAVLQVEKMNASELEELHTAYSSLVALPARGAMPIAAASIGLAYERGPMPGSHITPSKCGEYATIRWKRFSTLEWASLYQ